VCLGGECVEREYDDDFAGYGCRAFNRPVEDTAPGQEVELFGAPEALPRAARDDDRGDY
jgi:hypothetical protein